jgi:threonine/homoserine/homoserine lactone efflux protein
VPVLVLSIIGFLLGFVGSMPLAGPIAVLVVSRAVVKRYVEARRLAYGAAISEAIYAGVSFWGFSTFLARYRSFLPVSHAITAVVLLIVGLQFVRWKPRPPAHETERAGRTPFVLGFTISALNPTLLATWSAVVTAIYSRQIVVMKSWYALPFGLSAALGIALWFMTMVAFLKRFGGRFPASLVTWVVRSMGMLLIVIALWSGIDLARNLLHF